MKKKHKWEEWELPAPGPYGARHIWIECRYCHETHYPDDDESLGVLERKMLKTNVFCPEKSK